MMMNRGFAAVAALIGSDTSGDTTAFDYIAIGTGTTATAATDVTLETQTDIDAATGTRVTTTQTNDTLQLVYDAFTFTGNTAVTEVGVYNGSTGESTDCLLSRATFSAVNVTADDSLKVTVKYQIVAG